MKSTGHSERVDDESVHESYANVEFKPDNGSVCCGYNVVRNTLRRWAVCESWFRGFKILVAVQKNASEE